MQLRDVCIPSGWNYSKDESTPEITAFTSPTGALKVDLYRSTSKHPHNAVWLFVFSGGEYKPVYHEANLTRAGSRHKAIAWMHLWEMDDDSLRITCSLKHVQEWLHLLWHTRTQIQSNNFIS